MKAMSPANAHIKIKTMKTTPAVFSPEVIPSFTKAGLLEGLNIIYCIKKKYGIFNKIDLLKIIFR